MLKPLIQIERAGAIESKHYGSWCFLKGSYSSLMALDETICLRSAAKLFQTLACLRLGLKLNLKQIAICTSSHSGTVEHTKIVKEILNEFEINWHTLNCGEHSPFCKYTLWADKDTQERRLQNNCSGKHSMLLAVCKLKNLDLASYQQIEHPLQKEILKVLAELCEIDINQIEIGLDGCGLPTFGIKAQNLLIGFSKFQVDSSDEFIKQISLAILKESFYISGANRLDHEITKACSPNLICKSGAGGISLISLQNKNALLVKMHDSDEKMRALILKRLLINAKIPFNSEHKLFEEKIFNLLGEECAQIRFL